MLHKNFTGLFADIEWELKNLESLVSAIAEIMQSLSGKPSKSLVRASASILHDYYTGIEKIFERIASEIDGACHGAMIGI
ncbi:MAG: hypothetical protein ONB44_15090 [candidate division KSB1 bacterium]|nr:hypothetical protein [candidate division KSB1 bacterium]MDZ7303454.1 hypothetical protein [candidate division KSB1 bacterium]MDZ7312536.1 hypothetical protein [candidate division KSB1 bacterium]